MRKYIFVYLGGKFPESPAESQQHFQKYQEWLQSLGDAVNYIRPYRLRTRILFILMAEPNPVPCQTFPD